MTSLSKPSKQEITAQDLLVLAHGVQNDRGAEYESEGQGERSFSRIATAFNAITGHSITPAEVALLLQILKDVRQWTDPNRLHKDSVLDCISYASLKGEELYLQFK